MMRRAVRNNEPRTSSACRKTLAAGTRALATLVVSLQVLSAACDNLFAQQRAQEEKRAPATSPKDQERSHAVRSYNTLGKAVYFRYDSNERWERYAKVGDYPDVMVHIGDKGDRIIFWRGASYRPFLETAAIQASTTELKAEQRKPRSVVPNHTVVEYKTDRSYVDVLVPTQGDGPGLMFDTINRYAHARIIEASPARVVVELNRAVLDRSDTLPA